MGSRFNCMKTLEEVEWADSFSVLSYGLSVRLRVTDAYLLPLFKMVLPPYWEVSNPQASQAVDLDYSLVAEQTGSGPNQPRLHTGFAGSSPIVQHWDLNIALRAMESFLQLEVADRAKDRVFVHSGVVAWRGRAIILPGRSMAGKTTLVTRLMEAGCSYYSDEFAVLDAAGLVHPYARPLSVRDEAGALPKRLNADSFGGETGLEPIPAGLVLLSKYIPGASFRPRRVSRGRAVLGLMDNTVSIRREPERSLSALVGLSNTAPCWKGRRGDSEEAVRFVMDAVSRW
jgi:hypothetical protein